MPYKRYDITNKYNSRGRRVNEKVGLKRFFLFFTPLLIIMVILLGVFVSVKIDENSRTKAETPDNSVLNTVIGDDVLLRIVNENRPLEINYKPKLVPFGSVSVSEVAFNDLDNLISDAAADGIALTVTKGYVSFDDQDKLYKETFADMKKNKGYSEIKAESETKKICPEAGCSENQTGLLVTFSTGETGDFENTDAGKWLQKHSINYGFVLRYPEGEEGDTGMAYAPAVYRYVGKDHALNMRRYDMTLESYYYHVNVK